MRSSLGDRLRAARHFNFVGRQPEIDLFASILGRMPPAYQVIYIFGPGGVGKTTLLWQITYLCEQHHIPAIYLDARTIEPTPQGFLQALAKAVGRGEESSLYKTLAEQQTLVTICIDTFEMLTPLDNWLRDDFLPQLSENVLVVIASRSAPPFTWRADPGWQAIMQVIPLRNLTPDESMEYLIRRGIPEDQCKAVQDFAHGHPLATSLIADLFAQRAGFRFEPEESLDIIKTLLENFVRKVPSPAHRAALEVCALVRLTSEELLSTLLEMPDAELLFAWLQELSFIDFHRDGLFPHDVAREVLVKDLRWRNPTWYAELHHRARDYYLTKFSETKGREQQRILFDLIYLHRENAVVRPFFEWQVSGTFVTDTLQQEDIQPLQNMVAAHEGYESSRIASYWLARYPDGVLVWRDAGRPVGFLLMLPLQVVAQDRAIDDPGVQATWQYLQIHAPLRPHETATLFRFWMAAEDYQAVSPVQSLIFVNVVRHYLSTPGLAFTFFPCAEPEFWRQVFTYADLERLPGADFTVGERRYGVYGHDWRVMPPVPWLTMLGEKETASGVNILPPSEVRRVMVLSQPDFAEAVRDALRDFAKPDLLRFNPLLNSRLITESGALDTDISTLAATLQQIIYEALEYLQQNPRQMKLYRALYHTYLQPAPTQEQAAELLDLPFSTYRRHLKSGIEWLTQYLWNMEIGSA